MADPCPEIRSEPPGTSYLSPKRKRDDDDSLMVDAPLPSRLCTTNLPIRSILEDEITNEDSPRMSVAGHLQDLDLDAQNDSPQLHSQIHPDGIQAASPKPAFGSKIFNPSIYLPNEASNAPVTPPPSSHSTFPPIPHMDPQNQSMPLPLEIPETPRLRPVTSPTPSPPTPPPTALQTKPSKSPPTASPIQTLWWDDAEITGHDPKDPSDDGYGINGVGFLPTPAIANARAERRKRQVAEWKSREAREARQKRSDRRRRRCLELRPVGNPIVHAGDESRIDEGRKVRFLEV